MLLRRTARALVASMGLGLVIHGCGGRSDHTTAGNPSGAKGGSAGHSGAAGKGGSLASGGTGGSFPEGGAAGHDVPGGAGGSARAGTGGHGGTGASAGHGGSAAGVDGSNGGAGDGGTSGSGTDRGCPSPSAWSSNLVGCEGGYVHRPSAGACTLSPRQGAAGEGSAGGAAGQPSAWPYPCVTDDDCTDAPDGYCVYDPPVGEGVHCVYACRTDADCGSDELCACDDTKPTADIDVHLSLGVCTPASCHTDGECGAGSLCVASLDSVCVQVPKTTPQAFHCQSPADECNGADECWKSPVEDQYNPFSCRYGGTHFVCGDSQGC